MGTVGNHGATVAGRAGGGSGGGQLPAIHPHARRGGEADVGVAQADVAIAGASGPDLEHEIGAGAAGQAHLAAGRRAGVVDLRGAAADRVLGFVPPQRQRRGGMQDLVGLGPRGRRGDGGGGDVQQLAVGADQHGLGPAGVDVAAGLAHRGVDFPPGSASAMVIAIERAATRIATAAGPLRGHQQHAIRGFAGQPADARARRRPGACGGAQGDARILRCAPVQSIGAEFQMDLAVAFTVDVLEHHRVAATGDAFDDGHSGAFDTTRECDVHGLLSPTAATVERDPVRQQLVETGRLVLLAGVEGDHAAVVQHHDVGFPDPLVEPIGGLAAALHDAAAILPMPAAVTAGVELQVLRDYLIMFVAAGRIGGEQQGACRKVAAGTGQFAQVRLPAQLPAARIAVRLIGDLADLPPMPTRVPAFVQRNAARSGRLEHQQHAPVVIRTRLVRQLDRRHITDARGQARAAGGIVRGRRGGGRTGAQQRRCQPLHAGRRVLLHSLNRRPRARVLSWKRMSRGRVSPSPQNWCRLLPSRLVAENTSVVCGVTS